jgi:hypothetical protein
MPPSSRTPVFKEVPREPGYKELQLSKLYDDIQVLRRRVTSLEGEVDKLRSNPKPSESARKKPGRPPKQVEETNVDDNSKR